jgi:hypothetical protein
MKRFFVEFLANEQSVRTDIMSGTSANVLEKQVNTMIQKGKNGSTAFVALAKYDFAKVTQELL